MYVFHESLGCLVLSRLLLECGSLSLDAYFAKRSLGAVRPLASVAWSTLAGLVTVLAAGCASPGPPLPPSLKLPQVATKVTAARVGDAVILRWTMPTRTTDKLLIAGPITAEICRSTAAAGAGTCLHPLRRPPRARPWWTMCT